jgi:hypothetical protein
MPETVTEATEETVEAPPVEQAPPAPAPRRIKVNSSCTCS